MFNKVIMKTAFTKDPTCYHVTLPIHVSTYLIYLASTNFLQNIVKSLMECWPVKTCTVPVVLFTFGVSKTFSSDVAWRSWLMFLQNSEYLSFTLILMPSVSVKGPILLSRSHFERFPYITVCFQAMF